MKIFILVQLLVIVRHLRCESCGNDNVNDAKNQTAETEAKPKVPEIISPHWDNPNFIRDRLRKIIVKPEMPPTWTNRLQQRYDSNWMDYCDPYHCNDYHKTVCGLNRRKMKFKWFQSACHLILNNQCSYFRGHLKYDMIETRHCQAYVLFLRQGCTRSNDCHNQKTEPLCAMSSIDGHAVIFQNKCFLDAMNCRNSSLQEYDEVRMSLCESLLYQKNSKEGYKSDEEDDDPVNMLS